MSAELQNVVFPGLKDRVVIVTGAGQGIGRVFAKSFAKAGARAVIAELNEKKAAAVSEEIHEGWRPGPRRHNGRRRRKHRSRKWSRWWRTNSAALTC